MLDELARYGDAAAPTCRARCSRSAPRSRRSNSRACRHGRSNRPVLSPIWLVMLPVAVSRRRTPRSPSGRARATSGRPLAHPREQLGGGVLQPCRQPHRCLFEIGIKVVAGPRHVLHELAGDRQQLVGKVDAGSLQLLDHGAGRLRHRVGGLVGRGIEMVGDVASPPTAAPRPSGRRSRAAGR